MKKIMELLQNMKAKNEKKDNKGFSLVELIIVIAIMAILVGIVGTQVIPYISKSKVAKDQQVLNSISTAAVAAYSENAATGSFTIDVFSTTAPSDTTQATIQSDIKATSGFENLGDFTGALGADGKADIESVTVEFNATTHKAVTKANYKSGSTVKYKIKDVEATL
jgi:type IV pilus assembly protein PilA